MRTWLLVLLIGSVFACEYSEIDRLYLLDAARDRNIGVKVYLPAGDGPTPVVIFSHGLGGSQWGYAYLGRHLASRGMVSIHCTHPGSDWLLWDGKGPGSAMASLRKAAEDPANWRDRPRDISLVMDRFDELTQQAPALAGRLDRTRIAVVGHSFGAFTTMAIAGLKPTFPEAGAVDLTDPRPIAFVAMSPQGMGGFLPSGSWIGLTRPVLLLSGSEDEQPFSGSNHGLAWRMEAWNEIPVGAKWLAVMDGATHMTFSAGGMGEKAEPTKLETICAIVTSFLDSRFSNQPFTAPVLPGVTWMIGTAPGDQVDRNR